METDLTWLLLKPGRVIKDRDYKKEERAWGQVPTHAVLVEHPEGRIVWGTGVPCNWEENWGHTGFDKFFPFLDDPTGHHRIPRRQPGPAGSCSRGHRHPGSKA